MEIVSESGKKTAEIVLTKQGVANIIEGKVYVHEQLEKKDPQLYDWVLNHEMAHLAFGNRKKDILHDFTTIPRDIRWRLYKFTATTPGAGWQILPFRKIHLTDKNEDVMMIDPATTLAFAIMAVSVWLVGWVVHLW